MKLKYGLKKLDKKIEFQIFEQTELFRKTKDTNTLIFNASNGLQIMSASHVEMASGAICLRGQEKCYDNTVAMRPFNNNVERDIYYLKMQYALLEWARSAPALRAIPENSAEVESGDIFILK